MKMNVSFLVFILILVSGCSTAFQAAQQAKAVENANQVAEIIQPQISQPSYIQQGCSLMKNKNSDNYDCFGCIGNICKDPDLKVWEDTNQDQARSKGYNCIKTPNGCELLIAPVNPFK